MNSYTITKNGEPVSPTKEVLAEIAEQIEEENADIKKDEEKYPVDGENVFWAVSGAHLGFCSNNKEKMLYDLGFICDTKEQAKKRLDHDIALAKVLHYIRVNDLAVSGEDLVKDRRREYIFYDISINSFFINPYYAKTVPSKIPALKQGCASIIIKKFESELRIIFGV